MSQNEYYKKVIKTKSDENNKNFNGFDLCVFVGKHPRSDTVVHKKGNKRVGEESKS